MPSFTNVQYFNLQLDKFANEEVPGMVLLATKKLAFDIFAGVVETTPVDTGRARNNWHMSLHTPDDVVFDEADGGQHGSPPSGEHAQEQQYVLNNLKDLGVMVWIQNNLVYAPVLENGHSKQAPGGMVAVTMARVIASGIAELGS